MIQKKRNSFCVPFIYWCAFILPFSCECAVLASTGAFGFYLPMPRCVCHKVPPVRVDEAAATGGHLIQNTKHFLVLWILNYELPPSCSRWALRGGMSCSTTYCVVLLTGLWHFVKAEYLGSLGSVVFLLIKTGASVYRVKALLVSLAPSESRIATCLIGIILLVSALWLPTRVIGITGEMCLLKWTHGAPAKAALLVLYFLWGNTCKNAGDSRLAHWMSLVHVVVVLIWFAAWLENLLQTHAGSRT